MRSKVKVKITVTQNDTQHFAIPNYIHTPNLDAYQRTDRETDGIEQSNSLPNWPRAGQGLINENK